MYYLTYLSKNRRGINVDTEKESKYNKGRFSIKEFNNIEQYHIPVHNNSPLVLPTLRPSITEESYMEFTIPKKSGGTRVLHAPCEELKSLQKDILKQLNNRNILPHNAVHSFTSHRNCKTALEAHQQKHSRWFLKIDIKDYFTSITYDAMLEELTKNLRTRNTGLTDWLPYCFYKGVLPQGAPTSPILSNLYLLEFDHRLTQELKKLDKGFVYTRYADDILISNRKSFRFVDVVSLVSGLLAEYGCKVKTNKTRYGSFNGANWNLGIMYNNQFDLTVGHRNKHLLKNRVHNLFTKQWKEQDYRTEKFYLQGLLAYYLFIEPEYFKPLVERWKAKGYIL